MNEAHCSGCLIRRNNDCALRLLIAALRIAVAALGLAWLFSGNRKYPGCTGRVLHLAIAVGCVAALPFTVERVVLRCVIAWRGLTRGGINAIKI